VARLRVDSSGGGRGWGVASTLTPNPPPGGEGSRTNARAARREPDEWWPVSVVKSEACDLGDLHGLGSQDRCFREISFYHQFGTLVGHSDPRDRSGVELQKVGFDPIGEDHAARGGQRLQFQFRASAENSGDQ
jgi:hypothetical protein